MKIEKVVVCTDLEGVSGVVSFIDQAFGTGKYYEQAKKLLTAEINAAVAGMLAEGVTDILIIDGHGDGGICFEELHPAAKLLHGRPLPFRAVRSAVLREQGYQVAMMIGQHAMAGAERGNLNHTQCSETIEYFKLNGKYIGEIAQFALYCGSLDIPMIFLSGDRAACAETAELIPGVTTAAVKEGLNRTSAISLAAAKAHELISAGVRAALQKQQGDAKRIAIAPLKWPGPYVLEKRFLFTETADSTEMNPLYQRIDAKTVRLEFDDIGETIYA